MSGRAGSRVAGWALVALLAVVPALLHPRPEGPRPHLWCRLLGPAAGLVAGIQWVRFDQALREGRDELALARADAALAIDPGSAGGVSFLAYHLVFHAGSNALEPDADRRLAWIQAGIETIEQGIERAREPADLYFLLYWVHTFCALEHADLDWPEGVDSLWREADRALRRATELGHPMARELLEGSGDR